MLTALLVCLIPTTIGALLSAIGIAGMDRLVRRNVLAMSGRAVEAAGDVDVLLLDKTGTITLRQPAGHRAAPARRRRPGRAGRGGAAGLAGRRDTRGPQHRRAGRDGSTAGRADPGGAELIEFSASHPDERDRPARGRRDPQGRRLGGGHLGPADRRRRPSASSTSSSTRSARSGGTPLVVAEQTGDRAGPAARRHPPQGRRQGRASRALRRAARDGHPHRDDHRRQPAHRAAIAAEAGVDDFLAEATPEDKLALIRTEQEGGRIVAMCGDGTNDAPALAQADVGVAMNTGTTAAKEAGNMVDLDSDPTKLIDVVEIGKQLLITRGALTTFSIANDVAKYFAILPAMFVVAFPELDVLNVMQLSTPESAILSAVVFNALVIVALIPLSLRGVRYRRPRPPPAAPQPADLRRRRPDRPVRRASS